MGRPIVRVFVREEYGYREWLWRFAGTVEELIAYWQELKSVGSMFFNPAPGLGQKGEIQQLKNARDTSAAFQRRQAFIHVHEDDDSYLRVGECTYHHAGFVARPK